MVIVVLLRIFTSSALIMLICSLSIIVVVVSAYLVPFDRIEQLSYLAVRTYCVVDE